jgi:hypothetical protein
MIEAKQLRIGNTVMYEDQHHTVKEVYESGAELWGSGEIYSPPYRNIHPIPLTKELLVERGFTCHIDVLRFKQSGFEIEWHPAIKEVSVSDLKRTVFLPKKYEYLHQIENLILDMTGNELVKIEK